MQRQKAIKKFVMETCGSGALPAQPEQSGRTKLRCRPAHTRQDALQPRLRWASRESSVIRTGSGRVVGKGNHCHIEQIRFEAKIKRQRLISHSSDDFEDGFDLSLSIVGFQGFGFRSFDFRHFAVLFNSIRPSPATSGVGPLCLSTLSTRINLPTSRLSVKFHDFP